MRDHHNNGRLRDRVARGWWIVAVCLVVGVVVGALAGYAEKPTYRSQMKLVVPSANSSAAGKGPGSATEARVLAATYAAALPTEDSLVSALAGATGVSPATARADFAVTNQINTALLTVTWTGSSRDQARAGITTARRLLTTEGASPDVELPVTLQVTQAPTNPVRSKTGLPTIPLGVVIGLLLGAAVAVARDRSDPRAYAASPLARTVHTPVTVVAGDPAQVHALADRLSKLVRPGGTIGVVPLSDGDRAVARQVAAALDAAGDRGAAHYRAASTSALAVARGSVSDSPSDVTVLAVRRGAPLRSAEEAVDGFAAAHAAPAWTVLATPSKASGASAVAGGGGHEDDDGGHIDLRDDEERRSRSLISDLDR